ncbi:TetR family transcriptional regulator [Actinomycetota bacterium]|nr:TetR family transcriptional regulator [Actinomycetota bacterium]
MDSATSERPDTGVGRATRRDAQRNHDRIVRAARELFALRGLSAGLNDVAHHAGLGVATVYRHFPEKSDLVEAALEAPAREMVEVAEEADALEHGWDGLTLLLRRGADLLASNLGLRDAALGPEHYSPDGGVARRAFETRLARLIDRARADGDVRGGITVADVVMILWMVTEVAKHGGDAGPTVHRRYLELLCDGLRAHPAQGELPAPPTDLQAAEISRSWARA